MIARSPKPHVIEVADELIYVARSKGLRDPVWALIFAAATLSTRCGQPIAGLMTRVMRAKQAAMIVEREREEG